MASIKKFEDLEIWQAAREQSQECYRLSQISRSEGDYDLQNALPKTSGSVMDNIAEGFSRGGNKEFVQFLSIAAASCAEVKSQLYRFSDRPYCKVETTLYIEKCETLKNRISAFIHYLKNSEKKGYKFMEDQTNYGTNHGPLT